MVVDLDPIIFSLGSFQVRWYGLMYVVSFMVAAQLLVYLWKKGIWTIPDEVIEKILPNRLKKEEKRLSGFKKKERDQEIQKIKKNIPKECIDIYITYMLVGMFLGARLAYVFIYNWEYYSQNLTELLAVWKGGLSFHGAIAGMLVGSYLFSKNYGIPFLKLIDMASTVGCQGIFFGRIGNFINGELYGRTTTAPIGMIFKEGGLTPRHPSQLYEAVFEGLIIFLVLWAIKDKTKRWGQSTGVFFMLYGFFRFFIEFFREADAQLGYYFGGNITMGQILCALMFLSGLALFVYATKKGPIHQKEIGDFSKSAT